VCGRPRALDVVVSEKRIKTKETLEKTKETLEKTKETLEKTKETLENARPTSRAFVVAMCARVTRLRRMNTTRQSVRCSLP